MERIRRIFEGLNAIPWADLAHAYGSAAEVPMWLRQLASLDAEVRRNAYHQLAGSICHQGWICPATAYAVPFLLELMAEPSVGDREQILNLLADIASADPLPERPWRENEHIPQYNVPAHIPFKDAQAAVASGMTLYVRLLDNASPRIRMGSVHVLTSFPECAPEIRQHLLSALEKERDLQAMANLLLALGRVSLPEREEWSVLYNHFLASEHTLVKFAAALTLPGLAHDETPQDVADLLAAEMLSMEGRLEEYDNLPCGGGYAWSAAMRALYPLGGRRLEFLVPDLQKVLTDQVSPGPVRTHLLAELLLFIVFQGPSLQEHLVIRAAKSVSMAQRSVLIDLLGVAELWRTANFMRALKSYGLPMRREEMATYLSRPLEDTPHHAPTPLAGSPMAAQMAPVASPTLSVYPARGEDESQSTAPPPTHPFAGYVKRIRDLAPHLHIKQLQGKVRSEGDLDDEVITVNERYLFRFPHQVKSAETLTREIRLLRALRGHLPLPIPDPSLSGDDSSTRDLVVLGYEMLLGTPLYRELLESISPEDAAVRVSEQLGAFLQALHKVPVDELTVVLPVHMFSTPHWTDLYDNTRARIFPELPQTARENITARFEEFLSTHDSIPQSLIHGNFTPRVILYNAKKHTLSGIINFRHAARGDPAWDLASLLGPTGYDVRFMLRIQQAASSDVHTRQRAEFYALALTLSALLSSGDGRPVISESVLNWLTCE